ncbi:MAG: septal ring lytic transglycosylase RlpA family protein [Rhodospirillales bacterium]|nr:septal ring lytic transglycosylase RlpA family protein [Rhodospirillales bacterium]
MVFKGLHSFKLLIVLIGTAWFLGGCAETQLLMHASKRIGLSGTPDGIKYKLGRPYKIKGVTYYPKEDWEYDETGIASWYGPNFHGKKTANGETYNQWDLTAAHKTLPLPTFVQVTNLSNGRSLEVRINDRGPYAHGRIIDLSRRAAQLLGFEKQGTAKVRVRILRDKSLKAARATGKSYEVAKGETPITVDKMPKASVSSEPLDAPAGAKPVSQAAYKPVQAQPLAQPTSAKVVEPIVTQTAVSASNIYVQAGAFSRFDNANRVKAALAQVGDVKITSVLINGKDLFRVRLGPINSVQSADGILEQVIQVGYPDAKVIVN